MITNIGKAHLEGFGGVEGVQKGKGELFDVIGADDAVELATTQEDDGSTVQLDLFDASDEGAAADILRLWQVDPGYRAAVARLSTRARFAAEAA